MAGAGSVLAAVLTVVGGAFILAGGLLLWVVGTVLAHLVGLSSPLFVGGVIVGLVTIVVGGLMPFLPRAGKLLGAVALACAVASIPLAFGGFVVGFVLAVIGGAVAYTRARPEVVVSNAPASGRSPPWT